MARKFYKKGGRKKPQEFDQKLIDLARVTRVVAGGRRFRFRATLVIGDKKGRVGVGTAKGRDVSIAVEKAYAQAKKSVRSITMDNSTIPHEVRVKFKSARILLKPARKGTGIIAGGPVRAVVELSGIKDIVSKMLGSNNKMNNAQAALKALTSLESARDVQKRRGK